MSADVAIDGPAGIVTLRWPEKRNALGPADVEELTEAIATAAADDVAAIVVTGDGAFCSGGDLRAIAELTTELTEDRLSEVMYGSFQGLIRCLAACPVPTIAAVDGPAVGLGMDLVLACDIRLVGPDGWLRQGWAAAGLIPGTGGSAFLHALNPTLMWLLLTGQPCLDATACAAHGLAEVAEGGGALADALHRARSLSELPRATLEGYVSLTRPLRWPDDDHFAACAAAQASLLSSDHFRDFTERVLGGASESP